ncbi:hypothetical protein DL98DRAFT_529804 [Cadophora sp. DSE1049]|nr:hypothetical protein DL98DRAFT_529804 [Cadophora sp. DSE1049]
MSTPSSQDSKTTSRIWICSSGEAPMPRHWPLQYPCPTCYPITMWIPYKYANPLRIIQECQLYFKFDYSCIKCRKDHPENINHVIRRFRARDGFRGEGEGLLADPSPPLWTCKDCYPGPNGMWKKRKPGLVPVSESNGNDPALASASKGEDTTLVPPTASNGGDAEEANRRHSYRARVLPDWLVRVDTNLNAIEDDSPPRVEQ